MDWMDRLVILGAKLFKSHPSFKLPEIVEPHRFWEDIKSQPKPRDFAVNNRKEEKGRIIETISFTSRINRGNPYLNRVQGVVSLDKNNPKGPLIIIIHPHAAPNHLYDIRLAYFLKKLGYQIAYMDLPYHMSRLSDERYSRRPISANIEDTLLNAAQGTIDCVDFASFLRVGGMQRIGVTGTSLGGLISTLAVAQGDIDFSLPIVPVVDLAYVLWKGNIFRDAAQKIRSGGITSYDQLVLYLKPVIPKYLHCNSMGNKIMIIKGTNDEIVDSHRTKELSQQWSTGLIQMSGGHGRVMTEIFVKGFPKEANKFLINNLK